MKTPRFYSSSSDRDTRRIGRQFAARLQAGDIVFLSGRLGAGKTTFAGGVFQGLGIARVCRSSSFMLVSEYHSPLAPVYHIDLYRLAPGEPRVLGIEEYLTRKAISLVEWPEKLEDTAPSWTVTIDWEDENKRSISITRHRP